MCAIFGYHKLNEGSVVNPSFKDISFETMKHRGPDAEAFMEYDDGKVGIGHRRLSIIDTREIANQPMESKKSALAFNGEIYNYLELKKEFDENTIFDTESDTEILQKGLDLNGLTFLNRLNGMFAFSYFDKKTGNLYLVRDRFGVKPLHYFIEDEILYFASEITPLIRIKKKSKINKNVYLSFIEDTATDFDEQTFIDGIYQIKRGEYLVSDGKKIVLKKWYFGDDFSFSPEILKNKEIKNAFFEDLLTDAIDKRLRADVPIAITLSGGLDSTTIYTLIKERLERNVQTFTFRHPGEATDEYRLVEELTSRYGDKPTPIVSSTENIGEDMKRSLQSLEFPTWNPSAIAYFDTYKTIAGQKFKVVLEGHGSDEQLGGYSFMIQSSFFEALKEGRIKTAFKRFRILKNTDNPALGQGGRTLKGMWRSIASEIMHKKRPSNSFPLCVEKTWNYSILPIVLRTFDRLTMASSLESRSPFLDYRVVEFISKLTTDDKVAEIGSKSPLRNILKKYGQEHIYQNKAKMGFASDMKKFFADKEIRSLLQKLIEDFSISGYKQLRDKALDALRNEDSREYGMVWKIASLSFITKYHGIEE